MKPAQKLKGARLEAGQTQERAVSYTHLHLGALALLGAHGGEPLGALQNDLGHVGVSLHLSLIHIYASASGKSKWCTK